MKTVVHSSGYINTLEMHISLFKMDLSIKRSTQPQLKILQSELFIRDNEGTATAMTRITTQSPSSSSILAGKNFTFLSPSFYFFPTLRFVCEWKTKIKPNCVLCAFESKKKSYVFIFHFQADYQYFSV
jgi:hypothetical protein